MSVIERPASLDDAAIAHYRLVGPIMEQLFGSIPLVWAAYPSGVEKPPQFHIRYYGNWTRLTAEHVEHLAAIGAREFYSWSPLPADPTHSRFARLLLTHHRDVSKDPSCHPEVSKGPSCHPEVSKGGRGIEALRNAATALRKLLAEEGRDAIPVLDGLGNIALWVPVSGGPAYDAVRTWAHALAKRAVQQYGELISTAPNTVDDERVHLHVSSNAVDRWSILPYSLRAVTGRIAVPIYWNELQSIDVDGVPIADLPQWLESHGEPFGARLGQTPAQPIASQEEATFMPANPLAGHNGRSAVVNAAIQILTDGKTRSADEILKIAHERGLLTGTTSRNVYTELNAYVHRTLGRGRKPKIVKTVDHEFRINEPADPWPDAPAATSTAPAVDVDKLVAQLWATAKDSQNSDKFEQAVCDAFTVLGFLTAHVGGHAAPDGYADAPLGTMGYRVMLECKSGSVMEHGPNVYEAAKYKDAYHAQYCVLIGSESGASEDEVMSEAQTHGVSLWSVDDLAFALQNKLTLLELEPAFGPGAVASDVLPDILWDRNHGRAKRVGIIAAILRSAGWTTQCAAAQGGSPTDAPLLTEDAAMLLIDQELGAQGAHANCTREEVRLAFEWLTNPLNGAAAWNADKTAIVIVLFKI